MITSTPAGLYCEDGAFHIDPWQPVERAVITHAHGDHARAGSRAYLCSPECAPLLRHRVPEGVIETSAWREPITMGRVRVSFHPAGHILGSAQIRLERGGEVWVVSGDYKRMPDPTCAAFEPVPCHTFITEATFALPVYTWDSTTSVMSELLHWWESNRAQGRASILFCYALGKAQRVLAELRDAVRDPIHLHGAMLAFTSIYRALGVRLAATEHVSEGARGRGLAGTLVLAPLSARGTPWMRRFPNPSTAFASGLMRVRGVRRQRGFDRGFVLSDHADWRALLDTIAETGASRVLATHGWSDVLARFLGEQGLETGTLATRFEGESGELATEPNPPA